LEGYPNLIPVLGWLYLNRNVMQHNSNMKTEKAGTFRKCLKHKTNT